MRRRNFWWLVVVAGSRFYKHTLDSLGRLILVAGILGLPVAGFALTGQPIEAYLVLGALTVAVGLAEGAYEVTRDAEARSRELATELASVTGDSTGDGVLVARFVERGLSLAASTRQLRDDGQIGAVRADAEGWVAEVKTWLADNRPALAPRFEMANSKPRYVDPGSPRFHLGELEHTIRVRVQNLMDIQDRL